MEIPITARPDSPSWADLGVVAGMDSDQVLVRDCPEDVSQASIIWCFTHDELSILTSNPILLVSVLWL